jgi:ribosome-associated heat shock protein Hsp15
MTSGSTVRADKYLWAVRIYKTRSIAADECKKGRVLINGITVKPSREIKQGEIIIVRKPPVTYTYEVISTIENRLPAKLTAEYIKDLTAPEELLKLDLRPADNFGFRRKGLGRPTKKERRTINRLSDEFGI